MEIEIEDNGFEYDVPRREKGFSSPYSSPYTNRNTTIKLPPMITAERRDDNLDALRYSLPYLPDTKNGTVSKDETKRETKIAIGILFVLAVVFYAIVKIFLPL